MTKTLATLALAVVPALLLSACNGGSTGNASGVAALPNASQATTSFGPRMHRNDNGPQDLHAGGADFPEVAYNLTQQPVGNYNQSQPGPGAGSLFFSVPTTGTIYYCITGSGDGRKAFDGGPGDSQFPPTDPCAALGQTVTGFGGRQDPLDFVGSSTALASTDYTTYKQYREPATGTNYGEPFEIPQIGGPIVYLFRPPDFSASKIKFSTWSYCAISNGTISNWNDPALTADNGGTSLTGGVSEPITFYFRSDSAGISFAITNRLNTACNVSWKKPYNKAPYQSSGHSAAWTYGVNNTWPGPGSSGHPNANFIGEVGSSGIVAAVQSTAFSTGYVEGSAAKQASPALGQALLQNGTKNGAAIFVDPTNKTALVNAFKKVVASSIQYGGGSDGIPLGTSRPECVLYIDSSNFVSPPAKTYPIVLLSYLLFYGNNNGVHVPDKKTLIKYLYSNPANTIINGFENTPLALSVRTAALKALNGSGSVQPCLK
jgi:ABC-type phosphate transport system substrate-binding protein